MQVLGSKNEKITLVCGVHGEEVFGLDVFRYFKSRLDDKKGLKLILANEKALDREARYIKKDLNRCFPGDKNGCHEEKLANKLLKQTRSPKYLLDIHTSFSELKMTPIIVNRNKKIDQILNTTSAERVAHVQPGINDSSLIGQFKAGVSLEFGYEYAQKKKKLALERIEKIVDKLLADEQEKEKKRKIYKIDGIIEKNFEFPKDGANFKKLEELDVYPFLFYKRPEEDIYGLSASEFEEEII